MTWWHWSLNRTAEVGASQRVAVMILKLLSVYYHVKPKLKHFMLSIIQFSRYIICINVSLFQLITSTHPYWVYAEQIKCDILDKKHDFYRISTFIKNILQNMKPYLWNYSHLSIALVTLSNTASMKLLLIFFFSSVIYWSRLYLTNSWSLMSHSGMFVVARAVLVFTLFRSNFRCQLSFAWNFLWTTYIIIAFKTLCVTQSIRSYSYFGLQFRSLKCLRDAVMILYWFFYRATWSLVYILIHVQSCKNNAFDDIRVSTFTHLPWLT